MKRLTTLLIGMLLTAGAWAQDSVEVTQTQAKSMYKTVNKKWVSVHDPSVVWEPTSQRYYIFGSHRGVGYTTDMQNWTSASQTWQAGSNSAAFVTPAVKKVKKGKGLKPGIYKVTVNVRAAGNGNYNPVTKPVTFKVKVK